MSLDLCQTQFDAIMAMLSTAYDYYYHAQHNTTRKWANRAGPSKFRFTHLRLCKSWPSKQFLTSTPFLQMKLLICLGLQLQFLP